MSVNFVKFQRGSQDAYGLLRDRNAIDTDTLYFLYDKTQPENGGDLYLGYTLIGGTSTNSGSTVSSLNDLSDVSIIGSLSDGMILQYSGTRNKWVKKSIREAVEASGASLGSNVTVETTLASGQTISNYLSSIVNPGEGDIVVIAGNPYVYDGSDWVSLTNSDLLDRVATLENQISQLSTQLQTIRGEIDTKIANANHLTYQVLQAGQTLNDVNTSAPNISRTVFLVPNSSGDSNNGYDEYMYVDNHFEKLGSWGTDLSGYATTTALNTAISNIQNQLDGLSNTYVLQTVYSAQVGNYQSLLTATGKASTTVIDEVIDLYERLQWEELSST